MYLPNSLIRRQASILFTCSSRISLLRNKIGNVQGGSNMTGTNWLVYTQIVPVIFEPPCTITWNCYAFTLCLYPLDCRNSLIQFHSKRARLWRFNVTGNNKTYWYFLFPLVTKFGFCWRVLIKVPSIRFHGNPFSGSRADNVRTDGQAWLKQ